MKYLIKSLSILLIILFCLKFLIYTLNDGHKINYTIGNFTVKETLKVNAKDKLDNYYFEIKHEKFKTNFQIYKNYSKNKNIITNIKHTQYKDYQCIMPIFKGNKILTDIMCIKDNQITYYHDLKTKENNKFTKSLEKNNYKTSNYIDKTKTQKTNDIQILYEKNLINNHYVAVENYKGITLINSEIKKVKLFEDDNYKRPLSIFYDKYYIIADYNEKYSFKTFYVVNLINGKITEIHSYNEISFDSIMQGAIDQTIYIFDKDAKKQYQIDLKNKTIKETKNKILYYNGKWETMTLKEAIDGKTFNQYKTTKNKNYEKIDTIEYNKTGYIYSYKKQNNKYLAYRADIQNKALKTYLFTTSDLNSIIYLDNYIYYKNDKTWYYYYTYGNRKIITNTELQFNNDIKLGVYIK